VERDQMVCPYRGRQSDIEGQWLHIPLNPSMHTSKRARATSYVAEDKYGVVWMCIGEPANALDL
jgi:phenylpropionate dioxygenase-like ring-hydroxylating dioxygenase large terminal subunit